MNISVFIITAVMSLLFGTAVSSPSNNTDAERQARRASDEEVQAFLHKDAETLSKLWSDLFVITLSNRLVARREIAEQLESGSVAITSYERKIETARVYGDTVTLSGHETVVWGGQMPQAKKCQHLRFTAVWMKQQGRWQEVERSAHIVPCP
jgi:Domain of unknown function (DUF4440)